MKLHVLLRDRGIASRRKAEELIAAGKVYVDGKVGHIGQLVNGDEKITVGGKKVAVVDTAYKYYLVNKPVGITSTTAYFPGERRVTDLLPLSERRKPWQIAGRLDRESQGVMLITNDGNAVFVLTHPRFEVKKRYEVEIDRPLTPKEVSALQQGVGDYKFAEIHSRKALQYEVVLQEGKKREIREAFKLLGIRVESLKRTALGPLIARNCKEGEARELTKQELDELQLFIERASYSVNKKVRPLRKG